MCYACGIFDNAAFGRVIFNHKYVLSVCSCVALVKMCCFCECVQCLWAPKSDTCINSYDKSFFAGGPFELSEEDPLWNLRVFLRTVNGTVLKSEGNWRTFSLSLGEIEGSSSANSSSSSISRSRSSQRSRSIPLQSSPGHSRAAPEQPRATLREIEENPLWSLRVFQRTWVDIS